MNTRIILLAIAAVALGTSCSTVYRTGQTPDDVYFSPARESGGYVQANRQPDRRGAAQDYYEHPDDRYLRMMVRNRYRWSAFDNYGFMDWRMNPHMNPYMNPYMSPFASPFGFNAFHNPFGFSYFNSYWNWNSFHNPYYTGVVIVSPKVNPRAYNHVRNVNLNSYRNSNYYNNGQAIRRQPVTRGTYDRYYNQSNSNQQTGSGGRKIFSGSGNSGRDRYYSPQSGNRGADRPTRTYSPPTQPSRSSSAPPARSSSGGSSGGGVSRPGRGN